MAKAKIGFTVLISFLLGVGCTGLGISFLTIALWFAISSMLAVVIFGRTIGRLLVISFITLFLGSFYYHFYFLIRESRTRLMYGTLKNISGIVASEPNASPNGLSFSLESSSPFKGTILISNLSDNRPSYGAHITVSGTIERAVSERDLPIMKSPDLISITEVTPTLRGTLIRFKQFLMGQFKSSFSSDEASFLGGIIFGSHAVVSSELKNAMIASGTIHLVALSGYNITIIILALMTLLAKLKKRIRFCIITFVILLFVLMVGAEASIVRAAIMAFLALFAREIGRPYSVMISVLLTGTVMVIISPAALFDLGFLLSFTSLLGIIILEPKLTPLLSSSTFATTISAQLGVLPVVLYSFGTYSLLSPIPNILILPIIPFLMAFGFAFIACHALVAPLALGIKLLIVPLLHYVLFFVSLFAATPVALKGNFHSWLFVIAYYAILLVCVYPRYTIRNEKD